MVYLQLTVKASNTADEEGGHFSTTMVTVSVTRDRSMPVLQGQDRKTIAETIAVNTSVVTVHASDADLVVSTACLIIYIEWCMRAYKLMHAHMHKHTCMRACTHTHIYTIFAHTYYTYYT